MDTDLSRWILEFLLRQNLLDDRFLKVLIRVLPLPNNDPSLKKSLLLRKLDSDIKKGTISEHTLKVLEQIEELDYGEGNTEVSEAMKAAYCAVAVHCTVKSIKESSDDDNLKYFSAVRRIWRGKISKLENFDSTSSRVCLVSDNLLGWMDDLEAGVWVANYFEKVLVKYNELDVLEALFGYVKEAKEKMGPTFLELVAETLNGYSLNEVLDSGIEQEHHNQIKESAADGVPNADQYIDANAKSMDNGAHNGDDPSPSCDQNGEVLPANGDDLDGVILRDQKKGPRISLKEHNHTAYTFEWSDTNDKSIKWSLKKKPISPLKHKNKKVPQTRKKRRWTTIEEDTLQAGMLK